MAPSQPCEATSIAFLAVISRAITAISQTFLKFDAKKQPTGFAETAGCYVGICRRTNSKRLDLYPETRPCPHLDPEQAV